MKKDKFVRFELRLPQEMAQAIYTIASARECSPYRIVCDIVASYVQATTLPPLREDTMRLLYSVAQSAGYDNAEALVRDLCRALDRAMRELRGELRDDEPSVDNDIIEMFNSVLNEREVTIRKHS